METGGKTIRYHLEGSIFNQTEVDQWLYAGEFIIGRSTECDIIIPHLEVSRRHVRLKIKPEGEIYLTDLGSANGTHYKDLPLSPRSETLLQLGQTFFIGPFQFSLTNEQERVFEAEQAEVLPADEITSEGKGIADEAAVNIKPPAQEPSQTDVLEPHAQATMRLDQLKPEDMAIPEQREALLLTIEGGHEQWMEYVLTDGIWSIGRKEDNDIVLSDPCASRKHASIKVSGFLVIVMDVGSANGIQMNAGLLEAHEAHPLPIDESFHIGCYTFTLTKISQPEAIGKQTLSLEYRQSATLGQLTDSSLDEINKQLNLMGLEKISIGRADDNDITLDHPMVSRYHALIERMGTRFRILDTHSANGVYVNGERIDEICWLKEGDAIKIGLYHFTFTGTMIEQSSTEGYTIDVVKLKKYVTKSLNLLQEISLHIGQNEFVALVGMSGSGKTTLQDAINGYRPATHGQVFVNDIDLYQNYDMFNNDIGYVPQRDIVHMELTPETSLNYSAQLRMPADTRPHERKEAVQRTLIDLGLLERKDVPNARLSGGQLKRVSIGVELLTRPKLFFLDEPTSGLDPGTEYEMMKLFRRLADQGRTIMLITHATKNVMLCDKVIILASGGYLAFFGPPEDALEHFDYYRSQRERLEKDMEFDDIYRVLDDPLKGSPEEWAARFRNKIPGNLEDSLKPAADAKPARKVQKSKSKKVSALRQFLILSARNTNILIRDRISLVMMLALAPILGLFNIVWGPNLFDPILGNVSRVMSMWFMAAIIAILVGSMSSVREIVKELDIFKRERAVGLKVFPYTLSKLWIGALLSMYAALVILTFTILIVHPSVPNDLAYINLFITYTLGIFAGYLIGLAISAFVPNQNSAMILLVAILVPQLLLAGVLIPLETIPFGEELSSAISTRWIFEAFVRSTGIGDPLIKDSCWELDKEMRLQMSEEEKENCPCLGDSIFLSCNSIPGILSSDFYDAPAKTALAQPEPAKPLEPTAIPSPTSIASPTPFPSPSPYPTPTQFAMKFDLENYLKAVSDQQETYFNGRIDQLEAYQDEIKGITSDWADQQTDQLNNYADQSKSQYEEYADQMEGYGDEIAAWEKERQSAIGAAEMLLNTIYDNYGRTFKQTVSHRWMLISGINIALFIFILIFMRQKDVV